MYFDVNIYDMSFMCKEEMMFLDWNYSKCLYCGKDVDPHHNCQVVKQCKKENMRYCFHRSCMRKNRIKEQHPPLYF